MTQSFIIKLDCKKCKQKTLHTNFNGYDDDYSIICNKCGKKYVQKKKDDSKEWGYAELPKQKKKNVLY